MGRPLKGRFTLSSQPGIAHRMFFMRGLMGSTDCTVGLKLHASSYSSPDRRVSQQKQARLLPPGAKSDTPGEGSDLPGYSPIGT
jgi:hypothetical protein